MGKNILSIKGIKLNTKQLAVLSILMIDKNGKLDVAPSYMEEKLHQIESGDYKDTPEIVLDNINKNRYFTWLQKWGG